MPLSYDLEACYIIHTRNYKENSLLVDVFSLNHGRLSVIVKGSSKKNNSIKAKIKPFVALKLSLVKSKGELWFLKDCQVVGNFFSFTIPNLFCAIYLNELLYYLLKNNSCEPTLFASYINTLNDINNNYNIESSLRLFELNLLHSLGYGISFVDTNGQKFDDNKYYVFSLDNGFEESFLEYQESFSGKVLNDLACNQFSLTNTHARAIKYITNKILSFLLQNREIKSRSLYKKYLLELR